MNQQQLLALCKLGHSAPSADNSQPWQFVIEPNKVTIRYDVERVAGKTFPANSLATLLSLGSVIEAMSLACDINSIEYSLCIELTQHNTSTQYASFMFNDSVSENFTLEKEPLLGIRHTNRFAYKTKQPDSIQINTLINQATSNSEIHIEWIDNKPDIHKIAKLVRSASEIRFQTPEVHEWLMQSLRFGKQPEFEDGLHVSTLDLPPMGSQFMQFISPWSRSEKLNKLGMYKLMASIEAQPVKKAPGIMEFSCQNSSNARLQAGRDLFRLWLELNKLGLAVHPYFVITDQIVRLHDGSVPSTLINQASTLEQDTRRLFKLPDDHELCMLLRVGYPKKQAIRSKRLDIKNVTIIKD